MELPPTRILQDNPFYSIEHVNGGPVTPDASFSLVDGLVTLDAGYSLIDDVATAVPCPLGTTGDNPGCGTSGFEAAKGWDPVTGLGTPNYAKLLAAVNALP